MNKLAELKNRETDRAKVISWLASIGETDQRCIDEVLEHCKKDQEARAYYVSRHDEEKTGGIKNV